MHNIDIKKLNINLIQKYLLIKFIKIHLCFPIKVSIDT